MSASLVGSEMCIRDRVKGNYGLPGALFWGWATVARAAMPPKGMFGGADTCLLYTSDAADDM
eukprot:13338419-Alexandrium_andersonii.AAC.1